MKLSSTLNHIAAPILLSLLSGMGSVRAEAFQCVIVSGLQYEANEINRKDPLKSSQGNAPPPDVESVAISGVPQKVGLINRSATIRDEPCVTYGSWKALSDAQLKDSSTEPLLILQLAHGGKGGTCFSDASHPAFPNEPGEILGTLKALSAKRPVSSILDSCYAGDLLLKKLQADQKNHADPSIDNLCMISSSLPGRASLSTDVNYAEALTAKNLEPNVSMNQFFQKSKGGVISSADWSETGFLKLWSEGEKKEMLAAADQILPQIKERADYCPESASALKVAAAVCFSPEKVRALYMHMSNTMNDLPSQRLMEVVDDGLKKMGEDDKAQMNQSARLWMLHSLTGKKVFDFETTKNVFNEDIPYCGNNPIGPAYAMQAFCRGSLQRRVTKPAQPDPSNAEQMLDYRRHQACEKFKI